MAQILICDICKTRENVNRLNYPYDRCADGAGGSETVFQLYDICQTHEIAAMKRAVGTYIKSRKAGILTGYEFNTLLIAEIEGLISQYKRK